MNELRLGALRQALAHQPTRTQHNFTKVSEIFGCNVFTQDAMREYLPAETFRQLNENIASGEQISRRIADQVASSMKAWAMSRGATHYTHWFQPLNGATAEKHDAFFNPESGQRPFEAFDGSQLIQQEPDASSFPSGGIRNTFEARGYSAWDPTSPAFIIDGTLCIPTIFISYTGEALDFKTPLLKSISNLDKIATEVCQMFDKSVTRVFPTLGWEQEYFLIDEALYFSRPDLVLTGRTLQGHSSARGQQLEDHYFGAIPERIECFMKDFEYEAWKLGIPVKTRHNEVAPNQFELAPVYEEANLAVDHNQLIMVVMEKVARRHQLVVLFHEKPFQKVNGSGKHNNWSLATDTGKNLLSPGKTPKTNLQFLAFFINIIKAVNEHADLLRASVATAGNEHRLGANEAPPAIMSVFIGSYMTSVFDDLVKRVKDRKMTPDEKTALKLNIGKIPQIILDNTDRNRTSPFAFTGNKFEFRAPGSSANCAAPVIVLNTILAAQLKEFAREVNARMEDEANKDEAIFQVLRKYILDSKKILFEGNGYSDEWVKEAEKRGLPNIPTVPEALEAYVTKKSFRLFSDNKVFTERELQARTDIRLETYTKVIQLESRMLCDLCDNHIIPTAIRYQNLLMENLRGLKEVMNAPANDAFVKLQTQTIQEISEHVYSIRKGVVDMVNARKKANTMEDVKEQAQEYCHVVKPMLEEIRYHADKLEIVVDDELWPLTKYREMMFIR